MKLEIFVLGLALSGVLGYHSGGYGGGGGFGGRGGFGTVSKREAVNDAAAVAVARDADADDGTDLYSLVDALLQSARAGMTAEDLGEAAENIQTASDSIVDSRGGEVDRLNVLSEIDEAASTFNGAVAVSSLFDDPLNYEASKMDAALCLLDRLAGKARQEDESGESSTATVAAISMTAQAIQDTVMDTVEFVVFSAGQESEQDEQKEQNVEKRWKVKSHVDRDEFGRYRYGVGISHKWGERRKRSAARAVIKRGTWKGSVGGQYHGGGHYSVGGSISYSWGR